MNVNCFFTMKFFSAKSHCCGEKVRNFPMSTLIRQIIEVLVQMMIIRHLLWNYKRIRIWYHFPVETGYKIQLNFREVTYISLKFVTNVAVHILKARDRMNFEFFSSV